MTRSKKVRDSARGEDCTLQIHPWCNSNPETVVFAHLPSSGHGMGLKSPDYWGVYACSGCHDVLDQRNPQAIRELGWEEVQACMMRGLYRTQERLVAKGLMTIKGAA